MVRDDFLSHQLKAAPKICQLLLLLLLTCFNSHQASLFLPPETQGVDMC